LATIHSEFADALRHFDGNVGSFDRAHVYLEACARARLQSTGDAILPLTWVLLAAPLVLAVAWSAFRIQDVLSWRAYVSEIGLQPGIVVVRSGMRGGKFYIRGMRDPMALDPVAMLAPVGLTPDDVISDWEPYQTLDAKIALIRAKEILNPPGTVSLEIDGATLRAQGAADADWMMTAEKLARVLPGIASLDLSGLVDEDFQTKRAWDGCINRLRDEPGIVVLDAGTRDGRPFIRGMRDPEARDVNEIIHEGGVNPREVVGEWELFASSEPTIVEARAVRVLNPPRTISVAVRDGTLILEGTASHPWISEARAVARALPGVREIDGSKLVNRDAEALRREQAVIDEQVYRFIDQGTDMWPGQSKRLKALTAALERVATLSRRTGVDYTLAIYGHVKDGRDDDANQLASTAIARRFRDVLRQQEADCRYMTVNGLAGELPPGVKGPVPKRCVFLRLVSAAL
jgi:uncharacterized protein (DUF433 family)